MVCIFPENRHEMSSERRLVGVTFKRNGKPVSVHWYEDQTWSEVKDTAPFSGYNILLKGRIVNDDETPLSLDLASESVVHLIPSVTSPTKQSMVSPSTQVPTPAAAPQPTPAPTPVTPQPLPPAPAVNAKPAQADQGFFANIRSFFASWFS